MTDASTSTTEPTVGANRGVKRGLPPRALPEAAEDAATLWEVARLGTAPYMTFATKLGRRSASGGGWDQLMAVLRGFGLVRFEGDQQIGLTPLGQELVNGSDPTRQLAARRTALLTLKAYRDLVETFDGTPVPDAADLAYRLKFEYGKNDEVAGKAAQAFLNSLAFAKMVDASGTVRKNGADAAAEPTITDDEDEQADLIDAAFDGEDEEDEADSATSQADIAALPQQDTAPDVMLTQPGGQASNVTISVNLDLSRFHAGEVIQILNALKN